MGKCADTKASGTILFRQKREKLIAKRYFEQAILVNCAKLARGFAGPIALLKVP
jgi:hypothetical protein